MKRRPIFLCAITHQFIEEYLCFYGTKIFCHYEKLFCRFFPHLSNLLIHHVITTNMKLVVKENPVMTWKDSCALHFCKEKKNEIVNIFTRQVRCSRVGYSLLFKVFLSMFPNLLFELSYATYLCICNHKCRVVTI